jgi:hypothetical protein
MWSSVPAAMISAFGWMALAETAAYLLPDELVAQFMRAFNWSALRIFGGLFAVAVGIYLAGYGFGFSEAPCYTLNSPADSASR